MEKVKIKFKGIYALAYSMPLYSGIVKPGDVVETTKECADKLKTHKDWELVKEKKEKKGVEK